MKKKGFTLMELLAVVVILAILALITIPIITNLIKNSKKEAFRISVDQVSDNIYFHYAKDWLLEGMEEDKTFVFDTGENTNLLTVAGRLPSSGTITINPQGKISVNVNDGVYCAVKTIDQDKVSVGEIVNGACELTGEAVETCDLALGYTWNFNYITTGEDRSQEFSIPCSGNYRLEVWGAQGGGDSSYPGGYGGYSSGKISLKKDNKIYVNVGGAGGNCTGNCLANGGYNGGGNGHGNSDCNTNQMVGSGGGATHMALETGLLSSFENKQDKLLIVAGGGGAGSFCNSCCNYSKGGHAGGFIGVGAIDMGAKDWTIHGGKNAIGGTQEIGYEFGQGAGSSTSAYIGAGGGYYGGRGSTIAGAGGGSGYIGNRLLSDKFMYCYNCETSTNSSTYTISGNMYSNVASSSVAKKENGYARITYLGKKTSSTSCSYQTGYVWEYNYKEENGNGVEQTLSVPCKGIYKLEVWGAQGGGDSTYIGGYGGYSVGTILLDANSSLYLNVGGEGKKKYSNNCVVDGGYNGGGSGKSTSGCDSNQLTTSGGGATHIATETGLLSTFKTKQNKLLIVAGGGGGASYCNSCCNYAKGGHAGGYIGVGSIDMGAPHWNSNGGSSALGGTQEIGYEFGQGGYSTTSSSDGGGGGYYGGKNSGLNGAGGGSGYIGNSLLSNKHMYCYNCQTSPSTNENTYTISNGTNSCKNSDPMVDCAKLGNGYARITLLEIK